MILVVDDDERVRSAIAGALEDLAYRAAQASHGNAALSLIRSHHFEAVIVDLVMPGMTGVELAQEIAKIDPALPIIFTSGYADDFLLEQTFGPGVALLRKPFVMKQLSELLDSRLPRTMH